MWVGGSVLIKAHNRCISIGTEMTSVNTSKKSLVKSAIESPDEKIHENDITTMVEVCQYLMKHL